MGRRSDEKAAPQVTEVRVGREFAESLEETFQTDARYRRIVATSEDAHAYYDGWVAPDDLEPRVLEAKYGQLMIRVSTETISKMHGWVVDRSKGFTMEVQGRFVARRMRDHLWVEDFVPMPSFCQSLAYETTGRADREDRFGKAKMRTIGLDDYKPGGTRVYRDLGIFSERDLIPIDPLLVPIPFHSHYLKSEYQEGPSPGDYDHIFHIKWLFAPVTGRNIIYSGISPFQIELDYALPARGASVLGSVDQAPANPSDCEVWYSDGTRVRRLGIPDSHEGLVIGRSPGCGLPLDDPDASREHARVRFTPSGDLVVEDLGSKNGTFVGAERVEGFVVIYSPCDLRIGNTVLRVRF